jgi:hypothetical protein
MPTKFLHLSSQVWMMEESEDDIQENEKSCQTSAPVSPSMLANMVSVTTCLQTETVSDFSVGASSSSSAAAPAVEIKSPVKSADFGG